MKRREKATREPTTHTCLPDLLREQAALRPDATAVVHGTERLTYRDLVRRASELAGHLHRLGVMADDCVGLFVESSTELIIDVWGILFAGGAYLPLSTEYPEDRLRYMLENSAASVVVAQAELVERLSALAPPDTTIVTLPDSGGSDRSAPGPDPADLAYVIYTSGSTGEPKGVMIEHRSIVSQMRWLASEHGLNQDKIVLQKTPMSFDAAQWEILANACGSVVVMGGPGTQRDPDTLISIIRDHGVTTLQCVPTLLQALLDSDELPTCTSLVQLFAGGEALSAQLAQKVLDALPHCELVNLYGPTECTINSSAFTVDPDSVADGPNTVSIGTPVQDTEYHVLASDKAPVDTGEVGELYIRGIQLARGYLYRPELTDQRFVDSPFGDGKLFKTGDLVYRNPDGTVQFVGRADDQVKLRGNRVELDEIRHVVEAHDWVRHAAVLVKTDPRTGYQNLIACLELNPREAALMDQGNHGAHHQSKESRLQVRAQLMNAGTRDEAEIRGRSVIDLPGRTATEAQRRQAFARKTYRFYEGGEVTRADVLELLDGPAATATHPRHPADVDIEELGHILRHLGQHLSSQRLLPKYGYASPGSLYATQMYLEIIGIDGAPSGIYYYHPVEHQLMLITETSGPAGSRVLMHFSGKKRAIEPVYKNNLQEVLEIEAGHMVGLLEQVLPSHGFDIVDREPDPSVQDRLDVAEEDYYLGTFELTPYRGPRPDDSLALYVQAHPGKVADLPAGQYEYVDGRLELISSELVLRKQVIAINQSVYDRASIGISVITRNGPDWRRYIDLGRKLQQLSMNDVGLGFMSSGYSSKTGDDLPSALRIDEILSGLGRETGPSYFFLGGRVSAEQRRHEGMNEDTVHMRGPAEMVRDDLVGFLPDYMIPNKVVLLDELPTTANGKIDVKALEADEAIAAEPDDRPFVAPRNHVEHRIAEHWKKALKREVVSAQDDFFAIGGNSMIAVRLINDINRELQLSLPLEVLFECPTVQMLGKRISGSGSDRPARLVPLRQGEQTRPIFCWPGLGGYPMNLRVLAEKMGVDRAFYGVQASGLNAGETPYPTIREMAAEDVEAIRSLQPECPYTLWGYSFGARVAFETAYQLEQAGERVERVFLIAPGSPRVDSNGAQNDAPVYTNPAFVTILFSVFAGTISGSLLERCLAAATDEESFAAFIVENFDHLELDLVRRIIEIVATTFEFKYTFRELTDRRIDAPITIFKARGDDYSFLEAASDYSSSAPTVVELDADHYSMLKEPDVENLVAALSRHLGTPPPPTDRVHGRPLMPHVNIKHFPASLDAAQRSELVSAVTTALTTAFGCDEGAVSIAFEPVAQEFWAEKVYLPEIVNRKHTLGKVPNYVLART